MGLPGHRHGPSRPACARSPQPPGPPPSAQRRGRTMPKGGYPRETGCPLGACPKKVGMARSTTTASVRRALHHSLYGHGMPCPYFWDRLQGSARRPRDGRLWRRQGRADSRTYPAASRDARTNPHSAARGCRAVAGDARTDNEHIARTDLISLSPKRISLSLLLVVLRRIELAWSVNDRRLALRAHLIVALA